MKIGANSKLSHEFESWLREAVHDRQPSFRRALYADVVAAARFRGERFEFRSRLDVVGQAIRLALVSDSFLGQICYRAKVSCRARRIPIVPTILHRMAISQGQVCIGERVLVGPGLYLPHGQVIIDGITVIGAGAVIRPFVTIGLRDGNPFGPNIGDRAMIGTGAKLFGPIKIGAGAQVGANAVVDRDVPANRTAVGVPARILP